MEAAKNLRNCIVEADLTWFRGRFMPGIEIRINESGKIADIGSCLPKPPGMITHRFKSQALLPGFVNAHSHAFHRGLRDVPEFSVTTKGHNFWSWRDGVYDLAEKMTPSYFLKVCKQAFQEMLAAGITTVGEFHYFHHSQPLDSDDAGLYDFDDLILQAAEESGIRMVLLQTFYQRAGFDPRLELTKAQNKFYTRSVEEFLTNLDRLEGSIDSDRLSLGLAAHSVRAVDLPDIQTLYQEASDRAMPFHIHLEEQPQEISDCQLATDDLTPSQLLHDGLEPGKANITLVHCTHTAETDLTNWQSRLANICLCPLTEGRLGDGVFPWPEDPSLDLRICLGTDCNERISMTEELRWCLYNQQMRRVKRGLPGSPPGLAAPALMAMGTQAGARSLGLSTGTLEANLWADFFTIDLNLPCLASAEPEAIMDAFLFGADNEAIVQVAVGGVVQYSRLDSHVTDEVKPETFAGTPDLESQIKELNDSSVEDFLISLMHIPSTSGTETAVAESLARWFESQGWFVHRQKIESGTDRANLLITPQPWAPGSAGPPFLFNSHIDTVPPHIPPSVKDGIIYGRGSCDAKGVFAAMIFAALDLPEKLRAKTGFLLCVEEETTHLGAKIANDLDLKPRVVVCGEPTQLKALKAQKGIVKVKLIGCGTAAHSGYPHLGKSALEPLLSALEEVRRVSWPTDSILGPTTLNIGTISGGVAANVVPAYAEAVLMFRVVQSCQEIFNIVQEIATRHGLTIEKITSNEPYQLTEVPDFPTGIASFNTDLPYMDFRPETIRILFGPGSITDAHAPGEFITIADLHTAVDMYKQLVQQYCDNE